MTHLFISPITKKPSIWATGKDILAYSGVNLSDDEQRSHVLANLELGLQEVQPCMEQDREVSILAGGPSLADFTTDIQRHRSERALVTTNGAYNWALAMGMQPGAQIVLDGREFNKRFVQPAIQDCKYLLASQCHPALVGSTPRDQTYLWHCQGTGIEGIIKESGKEGDFYPVAGSMTVMLRAIPLLIMLGFRKFHIYGFDSCLRGDEHHAYAQPENDNAEVTEVRCTGSDRKFRCHSWMVSQAQQFIDIQPMIADICEMHVYGDGLIAHIINTGAKIARILEH